MEAKCHALNLCMENTWPSNGHVSNRLEGGALHPKPILLDGIEGKRERKGENKEKKRRERKEKIERNERKWKEGSCVGSISEKKGAGLRPNR